MQKIFEQGITIEIMGNCGESVAPYTEMRALGIDPRSIPEAISRLKAKEGTFLAFLEEVASMPLPTNIAFFVVHSTIRSKVIGFDNRVPTKEEMKKNLHEAMELGAMGLSSGLVYPPGCYAKPLELIELAKVVSEYKGGMYTSHMRSESFGVVESVKETIAILRSQML